MKLPKKRIKIEIEGVEILFKMPSPSSLQAISNEVERLQDTDKSESDKTNELTKYIAEFLSDLYAGEDELDCSESSLFELMFVLEEIKKKLTS